MMKRNSIRYYSNIKSPLGDLLLLGDGENITGLYMDSQRYRPLEQDNWKRQDALFIEAKKQVDAYFASELVIFDLPLKPRGTNFQSTVWQALLTIAYGETTSYKAIAEQISSPQAMRAVGLANGKNPIGIIIPCHRVIGSTGKLTGYGGGITKKQWLLNHEAKQAGLF